MQKWKEHAVEKTLARDYVMLCEQKHRIQEIVLHNTSFPLGQTALVILTRVRIEYNSAVPLHWAGW